MNTTVSTITRAALIITLTTNMWLSARAADHLLPSMTQGEHASTKASGVAMPEFTEGVVKKIDMGNKKITIKHDEIKNLDMPGMTMVFQVKDESLLSKAKAGDKVKFRAEKQAGAIVIFQMELAK